MGSWEGRKQKRKEGKFVNKNFNSKWERIRFFYLTPRLVELGQIRE